MQIELLEYTDGARIVSVDEDARIIDNELVGNFAIEVWGGAVLDGRWVRSKAIPIGRGSYRATIRYDDQGRMLFYQSGLGLPFEFAEGYKSYYPAGPFFEATSIWLLEADSQDLPPILYFDDPRISIFTSGYSTKKSGFYYPKVSRSGSPVEVGHTELDGVIRGQFDAVFFEPCASGFRISASPIGAVTIGDDPLARLDIPTTTELQFEIGNSQFAVAKMEGVNSSVGLRFVISRSRGGYDGFVYARRSTALNLAESGGAAATRQRIDVLVARGGWLSTQGLRPDNRGEASLASTLLAEEPEEGMAGVDSQFTKSSFISDPPVSLSITAPADRLSFHLPLPDENGRFGGGHEVRGDPLVARRWVPHFSYVDPGVDEPSSVREPKPANRFHGLTVHGLHTSEGAPVRLDPSAIRIYLEPPQAGVAKLEDDPSRRFHFEAGGGLDIEIAGHPHRSRVVPKPDFGLTTPRRTLDIPFEIMHLRIESDLVVGLDDPGGFRIDTAASETHGYELAILRSTVLGPPLGALSGEPTAGPQFIEGDGQTQGYKQWQMRQSAPMGLKLTVDEDPTLSLVLPFAGEQWIDGYETVPDRFPLLEYPGISMTLEPGLIGITPVFRDDDQYTKTTVKKKGDEQVLEFTGLSISLGYLNVDWIGEGVNKEVLGCIRDDQILYKNKKLDKTKYIKSKEVDKFQMVALVDDPASPSSAEAELAKFVKSNVELEADTQRVIWPLALSTVLLLWERTDKEDRSADWGKGKFAFTLASAGDRKPEKPCLAIDLAQNKGLAPQDVGLKQWKHLKDKAKVIWTQDPDTRPGSVQTKERRFPGDKEWKGIFFRDLPLIIPVDDQYLERLKEKSDALWRFYERLNNGLIARFGWKDDRRSAWYAESSNEEPWLISAPILALLFKLKIHNLVAMGRDSKPLRFEGLFSVVLPLFKNEAGDEFETPPIVFSMEQGGSGPSLDRLELAPPRGNRWETTSIPGFESIELRRFKTNFSVAYFDFDLYPNGDLVAGFSTFEKGKPVKASITIDLQKAKEESDSAGYVEKLRIDVVLPHKEQSQLFGKWPITIDSLTLIQEADEAGEHRLMIGGILELGPGFSIGFHADYFGRDGKYQFDLWLNGIGVNLNFGGYGLKGGLAWTAPEDVGKPTAIPTSNIGTVGAKRDIFGDLNLFSKDGLLGDEGGELRLVTRVGCRENRTFWVGALGAKTKIKLGKATLEDVLFFYSKDADINLGGSSLIDSVISDAQSSVLQALDPGGKPSEWLAGWNYKKGGGQLIMANAYLSLREGVAGSPNSKKLANSNQYRATLVFTDKGVIRAEGTVLFFESKPVPVSLVLDPRNKKFSAGVQVPSLSFPSETNKQFEVNPGLLDLSFGWGENTHVRISLGWPPKVGEESFERDWTKASRIYAQEWWPINTFWGGYKIEYESGGDQGGFIELGYAIKGGYTIDKRLAGASVQLEGEFSLGGVLVFRGVWDRPESLAPFYSPLQADLGLEQFPSISFLHVTQGDEGARRISALITISNDNIQFLLLDDWRLNAEVHAKVYGEVTGKVFNRKIASIKLDARALLFVCGPDAANEDRLVGEAWGRAKVDGHVKVLGIKKSFDAEYDYELVSGSCPDLGGSFGLASVFPTVVPSR